MAKRKRISKELFTANITGLSHDGRGVTKLDGKTVFLFGGLPDEKVLFQYTRVKSQYAEGKVITVEEPSALRVAAQCPHFGLCGGCNLQHLSPTEQIHHKQTVLLELLRHQANCEPSTILPPLTADAWGYRTKARLGAKFIPSKNKMVVGFRELNGGLVADLNECHIFHPSVGKKIDVLRATLYQLSIKTKIPQIEIAVDDQETALIIRHLEPIPESDLNMILQMAEQHQFKIYLQPKGMDSIHLVYPDNAKTNLQYQLPDYNLVFEFHPSSFTQINSKINQKMVAQAIELLNIHSDDQILDLFCGIGNFTLPIARQAKHVVGIEGDDSAVQLAKHNAALNQLNNTKFYCANLFEIIEKPPWNLPDFNKILLDPPRSGAQEIIEQLNGKASHIVYISCNPATLARDTKRLLDKGYQLVKAGVMDMFPHTKHVEAMALFELK